MYILDFSPGFNRDMKKIKKSGDKKLIPKIEILLEELMDEPRKGTGLPKPLKGYAERDVWSRKISSKHRLVYEIKEEEILVILISAYGHYDDK